MLASRADEIGRAARERARRQSRSMLVAFVIALALTLALGAGSSDGARTIHGLATAHLQLVRPEGSILIEKGPVSGALVGTVRAKLKTGSSYSAEFTITTAAGVIAGSGRATPSNKAGRYQSFHGSFRAVEGTGRYAHIHGEARLYGVFDRRFESVVVQTEGSLSY